MNTLKAEKRTMDIKAKRLRREGYVTGNLFGRKIEKSIPVKMQLRDVEKFLKTENKGSQIMLDVDGESYDVLVKDVDINPFTGVINEIDFQALVMDEKVRSVAEIVFLNQEQILDGIAQESLTEISYSALPAALVEKIEINLAGMKVGDSIQVKDLDIAKNKDVDLHTDLEATVVSISEVHADVEDEDEDEPAVVTE